MKHTIKKEINITFPHFVRKRYNHHSDIDHNNKYLCFKEDKVTGQYIMEELEVIEYNINGSSELKNKITFLKYLVDEEKIMWMLKQNFHLLESKFSEEDYYKIKEIWL